MLKSAQNAPVPGTLADVLYAGSANPLVPEQDWVHLVQSVAAGDQLALHALYERAHRVVFTLIMRITGKRETAEELTLEVFDDLWWRASSYDPQNGSVLGWIMNQARWRAIASRTADSQGVETTQQSRALRNALAILTPSEREAIQAAFFSELTNQPPGTVKARIRSGLHKLRQALAAEGSKP